eukprot:TRINITY_DN20056_c0_g1_i1.p1 TRINITY_DN20056_c0_g1~~TRINITY_DN20056_c0_g1_i1.p1  ORF type:complete len:285 (+),score=45.60 TRINITY_DN20056_c0_g1_i1:46-855(+)
MILWITTLVVASALLLLRFASDRVLDAISAWVAWALMPILKRVLVVPNRMYFVMDGNRRWAKGRNLQTQVGHLEGYNCLKRLLEAISLLEVEEVTVYAFSVSNFQRTATEKTYLMDLACDKLKEMLTRNDIVEKHDVRVRLVGEHDMLPKHVIDAANNAEKETSKRTKCTLNIAFAYSSQLEMQNLRKKGSLYVSEPTPSSPPPLFIRTSGESRFSDYLMYQSAFAHICFQSVLWPDYRAWHLLAALLDYNLYYKSAAAAMQKCFDKQN